MHFFTEPTIPSQDSISAIPYGPLSGLEETDFVTGSQFTFASLTKAFACQEGMMFIQQSLFSDCVNVILKPINPTDIEFTPVKYYVYRGLLKDSFLNGTAIRAKTTNESEFINDFWDNWEQYKTNTGQSGLPDPSPQSIGYDVSLSGTIKVEDIFNNSSADVRSVYVKEGDWIGNFGNTYTSVFEIITDSDHLDINLDFLRETSFPISVSSTTPTTPAEKFAQKVEREKILSFVDAAAFFGMHYDAGVKISTYSSPGNKQTETRKKDALYNDLISKFATKNRVYVDIRNERGYSYNFYDNYGDTNDHLLKVKAESAPDFTNDHYYTSKWPIFFDENPIYPTGRVNKLQIKLRIDDNIKPLLFLRNSTLRGKLRKSHFINEKKLLDGTAVDWSKAVQLKLPNTGASPSKINVAWHVQLQYLKQDESESDPNRVPVNQDSLDSLVPNINLPYQGGALAVFQHLQASKYTLISGDDFAYVARSGAYRDVDDVVFYTQPEYTYTESGNAYSMASDLRKTQNTPLTSSPVFPKNIKLSRVTVKEGIDDVFVITIANVNRFNKTTKKESLFLLGLTNNELDTLSDVADNLGLVKGHSVNLLFSDETLIDEAGKIPYRKYELNVQGLTADGFVSSTVSTGVFVYTLDGQSFNSKAFGNQSNISLGLPDPGTLTPWKYVGKWAYDSSVLLTENLHSDGFVSVEDKGNNYSLNPIDVELKGIAYYPSDGLFGSINNILSPRPVVFIVHGNGHKYNEYNSLCKYLAKNGFISVSINCQFDTNKFNLSPIPSHPKYEPFTHFFYGEKKSYLYCNTPGIPEYEKIYVLESQTLSSIETRLVKNWIKDVHYTISFVTNTISFLKVFRYLNGMAALGRSNVLYEHMKIIKAKFDTKISNNVGIIGHSRGGEAVVRSANNILTISGLSDINNVKSVISLAPTDVFLAPPFEILDKDIPFFVLYGSRDTDVDGRFTNNSFVKMRTGFSLYDRAINQEKSMIYVYKATHNGFVTDNKPDIKGASFATNTNLRQKFANSLETPTTQKSISLAYINAMMRKSLLNEDYWLPYFTGDFIPNSVQLNTQSIFSQYEPKYSEAKIVAFPSFSPSSVYPPVSVLNTVTKLNGQDPSLMNPIRLEEGDLLSLDKKINSSAFDLDTGTTPHDTRGLRLFWESGDIVSLEFPVQDLTNYNYLSFRIANCSREHAIKGLAVGITSGTNTQYITIKDIEVPDFDKEFFNLLQSNGQIRLPNKNHLQTIRIPLELYENLEIYLETVINISIKFPAVKEGKVNLDNFMFTN